MSLLFIFSGLTRPEPQVLVKQWRHLDPLKQDLKHIEMNRLKSMFKNYVLASLYHPTETYFMLCPVFCLTLQTSDIFSIYFLWANTHDKYTSLSDTAKVERVIKERILTFRDEQVEKYV